MNTLAFLPGTGETVAFPLGRFLPPVTRGMITVWLKENVPPGAWILDPIGFTPLIALEAAQAGYRVLVSCNNPILSFMLETLAKAPGKAALKSALAELSLIKRGEERLDAHLQSLYQTCCPSCKQIIQASGFLWKRGEKEPYARLIDCSLCGISGEFPITAEDINHLGHQGNPSLHRARAIERVSLQDDEIRPGIEEALRAYTPRSLYFITTLINKVEGSNLNPESRKLLRALILSVCDEGNSLFPWPPGRNRPRQLSIPPQFRENNLWLALENAIDFWDILQKPIPITSWPEQAPEAASGSVCLYHGRLKALLSQPGLVDPQATVTAFPRPSQAFWTLSAVWSGWLWGRDAVQPLRSALNRLRYDWDWHATALFNTFSTLSARVAQDHPVFGILPEVVPGFLGALVLAAESGGFGLQGLSLREDVSCAQFCLRRSSSAPKFLEPNERIQKNAHYAIGKIKDELIQFLQHRKEPASYLSLYATALISARETGMFPTISLDEPSQNIALRYFSNLSNSFEETLQKALQSPRSFRRLRGSEQNDESGFWWLHEAHSLSGNLIEDQNPLTDQVEMAIVRHLQDNPKCSYSNIEMQLCKLFPGLLTPPEDLVQVCLESYGVSGIVEGKQVWELRSEDQPAARRQDLNRIQDILAKIAYRLGLESSEKMPLLWKSPTGEVSYTIYPIASSIISRWVSAPKLLPSERCIIVLPGSRARLLAFKLRRNPLLAELANGWHFLKFRTLRQLLEQPLLDVRSFDSWLDSDPPDIEEARQMSIFESPDYD